MKKDWIAREMTIEVIVGAFMVMILLGLGYFTIILSKETVFRKKQVLTVHFADVMGLREGDNVVVRGMTIGKVKKLVLAEDGRGVDVSLSLDKPVSMKVGYKITVVSTSILGGRYLQIYEGPDDAKKLMLDRYDGEEPYDLMADAAEVVNAVKGSVIERGGIIESLKEAAANLRGITERLNSGQGTVGKLLSDDDTVYENLSASLASLRKITERIERGEGALGRLAQDDGLYEELEQTLKEVRATVDDFRETTPVVTFTSIFFGAF